MMDRSAPGKKKSEKTPAFSNEVGRLLGKNLDRLQSASLRYDKFLFIGGNSKKEQLKAVSDISKRFSSLPPSTEKSESFTLSLGSRMVVNMASGVLENAGLALHRHFNCPYIPGSSLKGIARHTAWSEWKNASHKDKPLIEEKALNIFGSSFSAGSAKGGQSNDNQKGSVAFFSAFPSNRNWQLAVDILNPHGGNDYTDPVPSFFLTVEKGAEFRFEIQLLDNRCPEDIQTAREWLKTGLIENGVGAKKTGGYGWFKDDTVKEESIEVSLVTPGFFGGASQYDEKDTTLRVSSLRGMLRWWWRTLFRDILGDGELKKLENLLWGSTDSTALIKTRVVYEKTPSVEVFRYKEGYNPDRDFASEHDIDGRNNGLFYLAYGMDEKKQGTRESRPYCSAGNQWRVLFSIRDNQKEIKLPGYNKSVSGESLLLQARAALSLLTRFGGIGSRSRKGFGSLQWKDSMTFEECRDAARSFCRTLGIEPGNSALPYSFQTAMTREIKISCSDEWRVLDRLGLAVKKIAGTYKHKGAKAVLGLPRKIHGPRPNGPMRHQNSSTWQKPEDLKAALRREGRPPKRFAAPIWYHFDRTDDGLLLRITAFPSGQIGSEQDSKRILKELIDEIETSLKTLKPKRNNPSGNSGYRAEKRKEPVDVRNTMGGLKAGDRTTALLLEEKTKKGKWKVCPVGTDFSGSVINSDKIPPDKQPGDEVEVIVKIAKEGKDNSSYEFVGSS